MSEFSESYHLRTDNAEDAVDLLRRAGEKGYVYPSGGGWTTFVSEGNLFEPNPAIINANKGILVHYVNQADYCCWFAIFDLSQMICGYRCDFEDPPEFDDSDYSRATLSRLVASEKAQEIAEFEKALRPSTLEEALVANPSQAFAALIGLEHFDYVAYDYVTRDLKENPEDVQGVIEVG